MTSKTDPKKLKALLQTSQEDSEPETEDTGADENEDLGIEPEDMASDDAPEGGEVTVESLTEGLKPGVAKLNEVIDDFRTGNEAQPHQGIEDLEEEIDAEVVHEFCEWTAEAGKKDFRALGDALDVEDIDGFVGFCRAVAAQQEEHPEGGDEEEAPEGEAEGGEEEPEAEGGNE